MPDLTSYQGNAGLGLGSNPQIPAIGKTDFDVVNQTLRDISAMDNEKNIRIFNQKVKDRDTLQQLILDDQVATGDILPEYMPAFDEAKKDVEKAFDSWKGDFNDVKGFQSYKQKEQHLKDVAAKAQVNTQVIKKMEVEKAGKPLMRDQERYASHIANERKKGLWGEITPYQQLHDIDMTDVNSGVNEIKGTERDPNDITKIYETSYIDYNDILKNKTNQLLDGDAAADSLLKLKDKLQNQYPQPELKEKMDAVDRQIDKYNRERGFQPNTAGYVEHVKRGVDANGNLLLSEPAAELAAKFVLANQPRFVTRTMKLDPQGVELKKHADDVALRNRKMNLDAQRLGYEGEKKNAYVKYMNARANKLTSTDAKERTDISRQLDSYIDNIQTINAGAKSGNWYALGLNSKKGTPTDVVRLDQLPENYQFVSGPVVNDKGKVVVKKITPYETEIDGVKVPYYIPKYVNPQSGKEVTDLKAKYEASDKNVLKENSISTYNEYLRYLRKNNMLEVVLQGQDGGATEGSIYSSAKTLNAQVTTDKEENIINPPSEAPDNE